ncbi:MAG TPA: hypothetical protein VK178_12020 [Opitutaceae bacterium]|nr:hypothetical protein [Opitutaceae bacterium]
MHRLLLLLALPTIAFAQGSLTPPGAPAPTMKTLDQIEARIPIDSLPRTSNGGHEITSPGSYYLTAGIAVTSGDAIVISARNVTLDLNGYTISSSASGSVYRGTAIRLADGITNVTIRNGHIFGDGTRQADGTFSGAGFDTGISGRWIDGTSPVQAGVVVEDVTVDGVAQSGISLQSLNAQVSRCRVNHSGGHGIWAADVVASQANNCRFYGIYADKVDDCRASTIAYSAIAAHTVTRCVGSSQNDAGISAQLVTASQGESVSGYGVSCDVISDTVGNSTSAYGIYAKTATNCTGTSKSGYGMVATNANNCTGSTQTGKQGLHVDGTAIGCRGLVSAPPSQANPPGYSGICGLYAEHAVNCDGRVETAVSPCVGLYSNTATGCTGTVVTLTGDPYQASSGLRAIVANNSTGSCDASTGLYAQNATNCAGTSTTSTGLSASTATNCYGSSNTGTGLRTSGAASYCSGRSNAVNGVAINATIAVACTSEKGTISGNKQLGTL